MYAQFLRQRLDAQPEYLPELSRVAVRRNPCTCVLAIKIAIPLVNPTTTGRGMNFTAVPSPVTPMTTSMTPAITVHMNSRRRRGRHDSGNHDDECAGGPADLRLGAAQQRTSKTRDDRAIDSGLRREARRNRKGHRQRQCHQADGDTGDEITQNLSSCSRGSREPISEANGRQRNQTPFFIIPTEANQQ